MTTWSAACIALAVKAVYCTARTVDHNASLPVDTRVALCLFIAASLILAACITFLFMTWSPQSLDPLRFFPPLTQPAPPLDTHASTSALQLTLSDKKRFYVGLSNPSIDCYFNSVVQSLASLVHLAQYLDDVTVMSRRWHVATPVTDALRSLLVLLNTPQSHRMTVAPRDLRRALQHRASHSQGIRTLLSAQQQQDAHELCVLLVEALDAELGTVQQARSDALRAACVGLQVLTAPSHIVHGRLRTQLGFDGDHSSNPFRGTLAQRTSCGQCGYMEAIRHFSFTDIDLVVPGAACTLEYCLSAWMQLEGIEWVCHRCSLLATMKRIELERIARDAQAIDHRQSARQLKKIRLLDAQLDRVAKVIRSGVHESELEASHALDGIVQERVLSTSATKQIMLAKAPRILLLHINRSSFSLGQFGASKNHARVLFSERLNLAPFITGSSLSSHPMKRLSTSHTPTWYVLRAIVTHYGTHNYGHYVSYRRRPNGVWTRVSDENVQLCAWDDVQAQNPYLLMYERVDGYDDNGCSESVNDIGNPHGGDLGEPRIFHSAPRTMIPPLHKTHVQPRTLHRWDAYAFLSRNHATPAA